MRSSSMELNKVQFGKYLKPSPPAPKQLEKHVRRLYPQLAEQLELMIKQAKLEKIKKETDGYP